jgi:DNA invertase Pin-like site-specific DNA recombinase
MRIGYARISTADQNPDLQEDALQKAGCEKIFRDVASGAVGSRRGLAEAIEYAREGDTLVVWNCDTLRVSRATLYRHLEKAVGK